MNILTLFESAKTPAAKRYIICILNEIVKCRSIYKCDAVTCSLDGVVSPQEPGFGALTNKLKVIIASANLPQL